MKKKSVPDPCFAAVTSGVPSLSRAHTCASPAWRPGPPAPAARWRHPSGWRALRTGSPARRRPAFEARPRSWLAKRAATFAQGRRQEAIAALFQPWPREADQHPALFHEVAKPCGHVAGNAPDVAEDDDRRRGVREFPGGLVKIGGLGFCDLGEGKKRPFEIVRWERSGWASSTPSLATNPTRRRCERPSRRRTPPAEGFPDNLQSGNLVSEVERKIERRLCKGARAWDSKGAAASRSPRAVTAATSPDRGPASVLRTRARIEPEPFGAGCVSASGPDPAASL